MIHACGIIGSINRIYDKSINRIYDQLWATFQTEDWHRWVVGG